MTDLGEVGSKLFQPDIINITRNKNLLKRAIVDWSQSRGLPEELATRYNFKPLVYDH